MTAQLADKVAVITGGASGIGRAAAELFSAAGAAVVIADTSPSGRAVAEDLARRNRRAIFIETDVSSAGQVEQCMAGAVAAFGGLTTIYNNAAPLHLVNDCDRSVTDLSEDVFDRIVAVVLRGTYLCCKYGLPHMIERGGGSIINTSTVDAVIGQGGYDAYAAAKGGVLSLTRSMAAAYADRGVRVNAILPGFVRTPASEEWLRNARAQEAIGALHLTRIGEPEDVAKFALYLASDDAEFVTGGWYTIDGGFTSFKTRVTNWGAL